MQISQFQPNLAEWFTAAGEDCDAQKFRNEDVTKSDRLGVLSDEVGFPHPRPSIFPSADVVFFSKEFQSLLRLRGDENCAFRLEPTIEGLPKMRTRGWTFRRSYEDWFKKQKFDPNSYNVSISFYKDDVVWRLIIVCKSEGIFGEIIKDSVHRISHGETKAKLFHFLYNFKDWEWSEYNSETALAVKKIISHLHISDKRKQKILKEKLESKFSRDYLVGYYEAAIHANGEVEIYDYNRFLPEIITIPQHFLAREVNNSDYILRGSVAHPGFVKGYVTIVTDDNINLIKSLGKDQIMVVDNTDIRYLPLMKQALAVVANRGSILSHAAIIAREMKKPCVIGTKNATKVLKDGDLVEVDANKGVVRIIAKK